MISVVVPAYNAQQTIDACLAALSACRPTAADEIIVVDDDSTDGTRERVRAHPVTLLTQPDNRGPSACRNRGAAAARGELLVFIDADVVVPPGALARIRERFDACPELAAISGTFAVQGPFASAAARYKALYNNYAHTVAASRPGAPRFVLGAVTAFRRTVFASCRGFDERLRVCEDDDLGYRCAAAGQLISIDLKLAVHHLKPVTLLQMLRSDAHRCATYVAMTLAREGGGLRLLGQRDEALSHLNVAFTWGSLQALLTLLLGLLAAGGAVPWPVPALSGALTLGLGWDFWRFLGHHMSPLRDWMLPLITLADQVALGCGITSGALSHLVRRGG